MRSMMSCCRLQTRTMSSILAFARDLGGLRLFLRQNIERNISMHHQVFKVVDNASTHILLSLMCFSSFSSLRNHQSTRPLQSLYWRTYHTGTDQLAVDELSCIWSAHLGPLIVPNKCTRKLTFVRRRWRIACKCYSCMMIL